MTYHEMELELTQTRIEESNFKHRLKDIINEAGMVPQLVSPVGYCDIYPAVMELVKAYKVF